MQLNEQKVSEKYYDAYSSYTLTLRNEEDTLNLSEYLQKLQFKVNPFLKN